jgi:hypothetical protein
VSSGGHALEDGCRGDVGGDRIRDRRNAVGWCDTVLGIGADGVGGRHLVTHARCGHAFAHRRNGAGHLGTEDERQLMWVRSRPKVGVDEIDADRLGFDQHLTGPGGGPRLLHVGKDLRSAGFLDFDRVHAQAFQHGMPALSMDSVTTCAGWRCVVHNRRES